MSEQDHKLEAEVAEVFSKKRHDLIALEAAVTAWAHELLVENTRLRAIADENYTEIISYFQDLLAPGDKISREELLAYLGSRVVHKPVAALRQEIKQLKAEQLNCELEVANQAVEIERLEAERDAALKEIANRAHFD